MQQNNRAVIERLLEAFKQGDLAAALEEFDPQVVARLPESLPYGGTYHGHDGMKQYAAKLRDTWESFLLPTEQIITENDTVILRERLQAKARSTGKEVDLPLILAYRLQNQKITSVEIFFWDVTTILDALSLDP